MILAMVGEDNGDVDVKDVEDVDDNDAASSGWLALIMVTMMDDVLGYDDVEDVDDDVELTQSCFELRTAHTLILMIM